MLARNIVSQIRRYSSTMNEATFNTTLLNNYLITHPETKFVRLHHVDYYSVPRCRLITLSRAQIIASDPTASSSTTAGPASWLATSLTGMEVDLINWDDNEWVPDFSTLRAHPADPEQAFLFCKLRDMGAKEGKEYADNVREVLRVVEEKARKGGIEFKVGFEVEFMFLESNKATKALDMAPQMWTAAGTRHETFKIVTEMAKFLEANGCPIWALHSEGSGRGQYEISTLPESPSRAVDDLFYTQEVIRAMAVKHGYHATCHPFPFEGGSSTGQHIHLSINKPELADSFLAGIFKHLRATRAFLNGGIDSYQGRNYYSGHGLGYWSRNKGGPINLINPGHWEFRSPDALGNGALQVAALIATGMDGNTAKLPLAQKPFDTLTIFPMTAEAKEHTQAVELPLTLADALQALEDDKQVFQEWLGEECVRGYLSGKAVEVKASANMDFAKRTAELLPVI
jgi:glutamine synthetase